AGISRTDTANRRAGWCDCGRIHFADRAVWRAALPSRGIRLAAAARARGVLGVVSLKTLRQAAKGNEATMSLEKLVEAEELPHVHEDHSLNIALDRMGANQLDLLPVADRADIHKLLGIVTARDILEIYGVAPRDENAPA